jgi:hypothetical protein
MVRNFCHHHSIGKRAQFEETAKSIGDLVLQAILAYFTSYPFDPLTDHGVSKDMFLTQFVIDKYAILNDIEKSIRTPHLELHDNQLLGETVPCIGPNFCAELICIACRISAILSTFESIQAISHIATSLKDTNLLNIVDMLFAQIKMTFPTYTKEEALSYCDPLSKLELSFDTAKNANAAVVPADQLLEASGQTISTVSRPVVTRDEGYVLA